MTDNTEEESIDAISAFCRDATKDDGSVDFEPPSSDTVEPNIYTIKPILIDKFKTLAVKEVIRNVMHTELFGKKYSSKEAKLWTKHIANHVNVKVRDMEWKRYKHIVQVVLGENRGAGIKNGVKFMWDSETDNYVSEIFTNDSIFCMVVVFAIYFY